MRQGLRALRTAMPNVLAMTDKLSPRMIHMIEDLCTDWRHLDARIATVSNEIETLSEQDDGAKRLMTVPGIGPIISSTMVAAIGTGDVFSKGRDFAAWLGLVPKQISTGDRTILGKISKKGNRYLRVLFVQAAWVVLIKPQRYVTLTKVANKDTQTVVSALIKQAKTIPNELYKSLTWDRGKELADHRRLTLATNIDVYFCDPQSPWQRGSNENTNGLLRQYLPKGTDLSVYSQAQLNKGLGSSTNDHARLWDLQPQPSDLMLVLHRPLEPAPRKVEIAVRL